MNHNHFTSGSPTIFCKVDVGLFKTEGEVPLNGFKDIDDLKEAVKAKFHPHLKGYSRSCLIVNISKWFSFGYKTLELRATDSIIKVLQRFDKLELLGSNHDLPVELLDDEVILEQSEAPTLAEARRCLSKLVFSIKEGKYFDILFLYYKYF